MSSRSYDDPFTVHLIEQVLPGALPEFLPTQRWFGGKARTIDRVTVADFAWLPGGSQRNGLALAELGYADGPSDRYAIVVGLREDPGNLPVIARPDEAQPMWVAEAVADHEGGHALLAGFVGTPAVPTLRGGALEFGDVTELAVHASTAGVPVRSIGAEQSNSSIRVGADLVFKLLRRIEGGENPEIEIGRFLTTRTAFRAMPSLHG
jgi:maltose alpha-D-glucosyltransferase/alpha-amylase